MSIPTPARLFEATTTQYIGVEGLDAISISHRISYPRPREFRALLHATHYGGLSVVSISTGSIRCVRGPVNLGDNYQPYARLSLVRGGGARSEQRGVQRVANRGDMIFTLEDRPSSTINVGTTSIVQTYVPIQSFIDADLDPVALTRGAWPTSHLTRHVARILSHAADNRISNAGINAVERIDDALADLILTTAASIGERQYVGPATDDALRLRIIDLIEHSFANPELTVARLAAHIGVSVRALHRLFEGQSSVGATLRAKRLDHGAHLLRHPAWATQTVAQIARECGYAADVQFRRAFRNRYGLSPRDYRSEPCQTDALR